MKKKSWLKLLIIVTGLLIIYWLIFGLNPTKASVDNFFEEYGSYICSPTSVGDFDEEYFCLYQLRRQSSTLAGQMIYVYESPWIIFPAVSLYIYTPFHSFWYTEPETNEYHIYVSVLTRDEGVLIYNPTTGEFIGNWEDFDENYISTSYNPENKEYVSNYDRLDNYNKTH